MVSNAYFAVVIKMLVRLSKRGSLSEEDIITLKKIITVSCGGLIVDLDEE